MILGFIGGGEYGLASLRGLLQQKEHAVKLIVTYTPEILTSPNVIVPKSALISHCDSLKNEQLVTSIIKNAGIDALICTNWRTEIPHKIIESSKYGGLNVHDSLLPNYAGLDAERWVILNNECYSGVTVHRMSRQIDMGAIVIQRPISVSPNETAMSLRRKQLDIYPNIVLDAINLIKSGNVKFKRYNPLNYHRFHAFKHSDYKYDFSQGPSYLKRFIRSTTDDKPKGYITVRGETYYPISIELPAINLRCVPGRVIGHIDKRVGVVTNCDESGLSGVLIHKCYDTNGSVVHAKSILHTGDQI